MASTEVSGVTHNAALDRQSKRLDMIHGLWVAMACAKENTYIGFGLKLGEDAFGSPVRCGKQGKSVGSVYLAHELVAKCNL